MVRRQTLPARKIRKTEFLNLFCVRSSLLQIWVVSCYSMFCVLTLVVRSVKNKKFNILDIWLYKQGESGLVRMIFCAWKMPYSDEAVSQNSITHENTARRKVLYCCTSVILRYILPTRTQIEVLFSFWQCNRHLCLFLPPLHYASLYQIFHSPLRLFMRDWSRTSQGHVINIYIYCWSTSYSFGVRGIMYLAPPRCLDRSKIQLHVKCPKTDGIWHSRCPLCKGLFLRFSGT